MKKKLSCLFFILTLLGGTLFVLEKFTMATHLPAGSGDVDFSFAVIGEDSGVKFPGRDSDQSCASVPDNGARWFNYVNDKFMKCFGGLPTEVIYNFASNRGLGGERNNAVITGDTWVRNHMAIGNNSILNFDPFLDQEAPIVLNVFELCSEGMI